MAPAKSGVGDYTRRLAAECIRQGHSAAVASLNETGLTEPRQEVQTEDGTEVPVLRLPSDMAWPIRWQKAKEWHPAQTAEVVSLQFVCFGFQPKGLMPLSFGRSLRNFAGNRGVHLMFHEIWLGVREDASIKHRLWGGVQKALILRMVHQLKPQIMQTQARPYQAILQQAGLTAGHQPLFSNIPNVRLLESRESLRARIITDALAFGLERQDSEPWLVGLFGTLYPEWTGDSLMKAFAPASQKAGKQVVFIVLGHHGRSAEEVERWREASPVGMVWLERSEISPEALSAILHALDFGAVATPLAMLEKSGAAAAFFDHGVPVVVTRDDCRFALPSKVPSPRSERHHLADEALTNWLLRTQPKEPQARLPSAAVQFLADLAQAKAMMVGSLFSTSSVA